MITEKERQILIDAELSKSLVSLKLRGVRITAYVADCPDLNPGPLASKAPIATIYRVSKRNGVFRAVSGHPEPLSEIEGVEVLGAMPESVENDIWTEEGKIAAFDPAQRQ